MQQPAAGRKDEVNRVGRVWLRSSSRTESRMPSREAAQLGVPGLGSHLGPTDSPGVVLVVVLVRTRPAISCVNMNFIKVLSLHRCRLRAPLVIECRGGEVLFRRPWAHPSTACGIKVKVCPVSTEVYVPVCTWEGRGGPSGPPRPYGLPVWVPAGQGTSPGHGSFTIWLLQNHKLTKRRNAQEGGPPFSKVRFTLLAN